jgi:hypothetical protein
MPPTKYGMCVSREIIRQSKYSQITSPIAKYDGGRIGNSLTCEWNCITKPVAMDAEPEVNNDCDQFMLFASTNLEDSLDFQAEIELPLGKEGKKQIINSPTYVYIPKGLKHGALKFKTVKKPIAYMSVFLDPQWSTKWTAPDESKYLAKIGAPDPMMISNPDSPPAVQAAHPDGKPFRYIKNAMGGGLGYNLWSGQMGFPAKLCCGYMVTRYREYAYLEPVHAHRAFHQISMYLGGNPLNIEDFDADIEIFLGKEREKHVIDTCAVDHMPPGMPHLGDEVRRVGKPFVHIMWVVGPNDYYKAAPTDKILLSNEAIGEVMIPTGANDYVPPTKMEDWVWPYPAKNK